MAPIILKGENLGEKRKHYNHLVKEAITKKTLTVVPPISFSEGDIDNLFKIDIACNNRDVDYIFEVFKCSDMLYVSRAIKQSKWLIHDSQYANIINPEYLFKELFPHMTSKARNKFLLQIRLTLRDEKRVESFCEHLMLQNLQNGLKWLPHCSAAFIESTIEKNANDISESLIARLFKKSFRFLEIYLTECNNYYVYNTMRSTLFFLKNNTEKYLDIVEPKKDFERFTPRFGSKATRYIMAKCSERVMNNLENYARYINIRTFAKYIKPNEMTDFIMKVVTNKQYSYFHKHDRIQHLIKRLPIEERFKFVKLFFIDKTYQGNGEFNLQHFLRGVYGQENRSKSAFNTIYSWYKFAPFDIAFQELKKLIKIESSSNERDAMMAVILQCAIQNIDNMKEVLHYYREKHINEPFMFKIHFINNFLSNTDVQRYDLKMWSLLNDIFTSMEVYEDSNKGIQTCIRCIILYNLIHDQTIPKIIEDKFIFDTFKAYQTKLDDINKIKLFNYLYLKQTEKFNALAVRNERDFDIALEILLNICNLISDWKKDISNYTLILENIKQLVHIKRKNHWNIDISKLYYVKCENNFWRKHLFNECILLNPTPEIIINVIKHDSKLVNIYKNEVIDILFNNTKSLQRLLTLIRVFWPDSLAIIFKQNYFNAIENDKTKYASAIFGLNILLPEKPFLELIYKHVPTETKINWREKNQSELALCKNIAKKLYLARPQPPLSIALLYAKGDYLQYVLPSLSSILYNMSSLQAQDQLKNLLDAPVSLHKHGIKTALNKLKRDDLDSVFSNMWSSTKNSSIRAEIIIQTFNLLCKQRKSSDIDEIWTLLQIFVNSLTCNENKIIYKTLCQVDKVPLSIRTEFWLKSYNLFSNLPETDYSSQLVEKLKENITDIMEFLDVDIIRTIYLHSFENNFTKKIYDDSQHLAVYLLSVRNIESQNIRYNKLLLPIIENAFTCWNVKHNDTYYARINLTTLFKSLLSEIQKYVLNNKMALPVATFNNISKKVTQNLQIVENYFLVTFVKLSDRYVNILDNIIKTNDAFKDDSYCIKKDNWESLYVEAAPAFGKVCLDFLKEDVKNLFSSIYKLFASSLKDFFNQQDHFTSARLIILKTILECEDFVEGYLLVIKLIPKYVCDEKDRVLRLEILNKIKNHPADEVKIHYWMYGDCLI